MRKPRHTEGVVSVNLNNWSESQKIGLWEGKTAANLAPGMDLGKACAVVMQILYTFFSFIYT